MRSRAALVLGPLALAWALASASGQGADAPSAKESAPANPSAPASLTNSPPGAARRLDRLSAGDKLHFFIEEDPIKGTGPIELMVSAIGDVSFPVSRNSDVMIALTVKDKSIAEVKEELKTKLDADYYQNATVFLKLQDQAPRRGQILFSGQVRGNVLNVASGETMSLFEAILKVQATEFANLRRVKVHRLDPVTQKTETRIFNVKEMLGGDRSKDFQLQDGDHVEVPEKSLVF